MGICADRSHGLPDERPEPLPLAAEDERGRAGEVHAREGGVAVGRERDGPDALLLERLERLRDVRDPGDRAALHRARRGLRDRGGHADGAVLGDDDAVRAERVGGADDRAEVVRVLDPVEHDERAAAGRSRAPRRGASPRSAYRKSATTATTPWWRSVPGEPVELRARRASAPSRPPPRPSRSSSANAAPRVPPSASQSSESPSPPARRSSRTGFRP